MSDRSQQYSMYGHISIEAIMDVARKSASCFSCENCNIEENKCNLFGSQPPMRIIRDGCPQYIPNIPF